MTTPLRWEDLGGGAPPPPSVVSSPPLRWDTMTVAAPSTPSAPAAPRPATISADATAITPFRVTPAHPILGALLNYVVPTGIEGPGGQRMAAQFSVSTGQQLQALSMGVLGASAAFAPAIVASSAVVSGSVHYAAHPERGPGGALENAINSGFGIAQPLASIATQQGASGLASTLTSHPLISELVLQGTLGISPAILGERLANAAGATIPSAAQLQGAISEGLKGVGVASDDAAARAAQVAAVLTGPTRPAVFDDLLKALAPDLRSPGAMRAALSLREHTGRLAQVTEQTVERVKPIRAALGALPDDAQFDFIHRMEAGAAQPTPQLQAAADQLRSLLDNTRDQVRALGTGKLENFIENYFPHIWQDPDAARNVFSRIMGNRPLQGPRSFLMQRTIPTTAEGLANGLRPVTSNPVDLTLLKVYEMRRYIMAQRVFGELRSEGLARFVRAGEEAEGTFAGPGTRINDDIAVVRGPRQGAVIVPEGATVPAAGTNLPVPLQPEQVGVVGRRVMGEYRAPEPVARILNNYLSSGLRGNSLFDAYRTAGNVMNQAQLGLTAFHAGFTSMEAIVSRNAVAIGELLSGRPIAGALDALSSPLAPITNIWRGDRLLRAYLRPDEASGGLAEMVQAVAEAGGRVRMDPFYRTQQMTKLRQALGAGNYGEASLRTVPATLEALSWPVMEWLVPRQKLGAFSDLAQLELSRLPTNATRADRLAVLARSWDSIDNRFGQLVYDNLFWNKTWKDLGMAGVRSLGWNLGTIRELGGGLRDLGKLATTDVSRITPKAMYTMSLPFTVGLAGAVTSYLMTGRGPQELRDYYYPPTGRANPDGTSERVQMPSYMKDVFAYGRHPYETVKHKLNPLLASVSDMLENEDFYGDQIRNPTDPLVQQAGQVLQYAVKQFEPFSVRYALQDQRRNQGAARSALNFVGITPAPREVIRTDAENLMATMLRARRGVMTPEERTQTDLEGDLRARLQRRDPDAMQQIGQAVLARTITPGQRMDIIRGARTPLAVSQFKRLTVQEAATVYRTATPEERQRFWALFVQKAQNAARGGDANGYAAFLSVRNEELERRTTAGATMQASRGAVLNP